MTRFTKTGLVALVGAMLLATTADAALFNRAFFRYTGPRNAAMAPGYRTQGHTEATGLGTAVDGRARMVRRYNGPVAAPGVRVEGHTEATGLGTAVDGR